LELLDRYLHAIKPLLPRKTQEDILRELSDDILTQIEEKEITLGRPLTEAEQEEVIKRHGHPIVVAGRYGRAQYLIGPTVFPFYWLVLRIAAIGALIVRWIIAMVIISSSHDPAGTIVSAILAVPGVLVPVFAWVTAAFAVGEYCLSFFHINLKGGGWSPRSLPPVHGRRFDTSRASSFAEVLFGSAFVLWWQSVPAAPYLALGPAAGFLALAPVWNTLHWPILLLAVAGIVQSAVNLVRPQLTPARITIRILIHLFALALLCILLQAANWIIAAPGIPDPGHYAKAIGILNQVFFYCIASAIGITIVQIALEFRKYGQRLFIGCRPEHALRRP
jgi:hypothetical protein